MDVQPAKWEDQCTQPVWVDAAYLGNKLISWPALSTIAENGQSEKLAVRTTTTETARNTDNLNEEERKD